MYGSASRTAATNSARVASSTTKVVVSAKPVVSTTYRAFTNPCTFCSSSVSGYAGAALDAERTTAVSTSSTENTESCPDAAGPAFVATVSFGTGTDVTPPASSSVAAGARLTSRD